jgi:hypothetical protein
MAEPIRVQLRRSKGWRMPENTVKVDRSTKWGNPYRVGQEGHFVFEKMTDAQLRAFDFTPRLETLPCCGRVVEVRPLPPNRYVKFSAPLTIGETLARYREWIEEGMLDLTPLRGKNLACWCPIGSPCHADVLLELANAPERANG